MAFVRVAAVAQEDLAALIEVLSLPADTKVRVKRSIAQLESFPLSGQHLAGAWQGFRCLGGPWRWMLIVYEYEPETDVATVVTIQDARSSTAVKNV